MPSMTESNVEGENWFYSRIEMLHGFSQPDKDGNYTFLAYWYTTYRSGPPGRSDYGMFEVGQVFCRPDVPGPDKIDPSWRPPALPEEFLRKKEEEAAVVAERLRRLHAGEGWASDAG